MNNEVIENNKKYIQKSTYIILAYGIFHMIVALSFINDKNFSGVPAGEIVVWSLIILFTYLSYRFLSITSGILSLFMLLFHFFAAMGMNTETEAIINLILIIVLTTILYRIYKQKKYITLFEKNFQN